MAESVLPAEPAAQGERPTAMTAEDVAAVSSLAAAVEPMERESLLDVLDDAAEPADGQVT